MNPQVPHLERAVELLWQVGHPRIGDALEKEVQAIIEKADRLERILKPSLAAKRDAMIARRGKPVH